MTHEGFRDVALAALFYAAVILAAASILYGVIRLAVRAAIQDTVDALKPTESAADQ